MSTEAHLGPFVAALVALVDARIARALAPTTNHYSTEARDLYPPGRYADDEHKARRQARDRIARHPAHERIGTGKATVWRIDRDAYHAKPIAPVMPLVTAPTSDEEIARAAIDKAGLRATRRAS